MRILVAVILIFGMSAALAQQPVQKSRADFLVEAMGSQRDRAQADAAACYADASAMIAELNAKIADLKAKLPKDESKPDAPK